MTAGWIKLSADQAAMVGALSGSNETNNFLRPRTDAQNQQWLPACVLDEDIGVFSHYSAVLDELDVTQIALPTWPPEVQA